MRKTYCSLAATALLYLATCMAFAQHVKTDYDPRANFEHYHSYSWAKMLTDAPWCQARVTEAVDRELQAKGWQRRESGGDVVLAAVGATRDRQTYQAFYDGFAGWGWRGFSPGAATATVENYQIGTLVLDVYDARNKELLWRGSAQDTLPRKPAKNPTRLNKAVDMMLKNFPPEGQNNAHLAPASAASAAK